MHIANSINVVQDECSIIKVQYMAKHPVSKDMLAQDHTPANSIVDIILFMHRAVTGKSLYLLNIIFKIFAPQNMLFKKLFPVCLFIVFVNASMAQMFKKSSADSAKQVLKNYDQNDTRYFNTCLFLSKYCIDNKYYDTAQVWLDKVSDSRELQKQSINHYLFLSLQLAVYSHWNIDQLGLRESHKANALALSLNDSALIQDSYRWLASFNFNIDSIETSVSYAHKALAFYPKTNFPASYFVVSKLYNLYDDIAWSQSKLHRYDSAILYAQKALSLLNNTDDLNLKVQVYNSVGIFYGKLGQWNSARFYYDSLYAIATFQNNNDYRLIALTGFAHFFDAKKDYKHLMYFVNEGEHIIESGSNINTFYASHFLAVSAGILKKYRNFKEVVTLLEYASIQDRIYRNNIDNQVKQFENAALKKETIVLSLEVDKLKQENKLKGIVVLTLLMACIFSFIIQRILLKKRIEKQALITNERERIITDLHDDVGATLSSLHIYGDLAKNIWNTRPVESREMIEKISTTSKDLMGRMGDIIWSMKPAGEEKYSFTARLKNYANELLSPKNIVCKFDIDETLSKQISHPEVRKNILLIAKEAMNNIAKYSEASKATVSLLQKDESIVLIISDDGKGYAASPLQESGVYSGNGLQNIQRRCRHLKGTCTLESSPGQGLKIVCDFPIAIISHTL